MEGVFCCVVLPFLWGGRLSRSPRLANGNLLQIDVESWGDLSLCFPKRIGRNNATPFTGGVRLLRPFLK
jgi:hypothetical protein